MHYELLYSRYEVINTVLHSKLDVRNHFTSKYSIQGTKLLNPNGFLQGMPNLI